MIVLDTKSSEQIRKDSEDNCAWIRRKVAEKGWTWNIMGLAFDRLKPGLSLGDKLQLLALLNQITREAPETEICDAVLASEVRVYY